MGHMCTHVPYAVVSYIKLSGDLFLSLAKWEQLSHRYLQQCSQPTYTSSKPLQKHPVSEISFKQRNSKHDIPSGAAVSPMQFVTSFGLVTVRDASNDCFH